VRYLLRKILFYIVAFCAAITINFALPRLLPGNPVDVMLAKLAQRGQVEPETRAAIEAMLGTTDDASLLSQFGDYLVNIFQGDLGVSVTFFPTPVITVIGQALPWTILLVGIATVISFVIAQLLGMLAGWKRGGWLDSFIPASTVLQAVPYFWLALILSYVFAVTLGVFPISGGYDYRTVSAGWSWEFLGSAIKYGTLPALTIVISSLGAGLVGMRNMMVSTMAEDYIVTAEAKGLRPRRIMTMYAGRNAVLPSVAGFGIALGAVVGGSILTEQVFSYPGIGQTLLQSVQNNDYALMQGVFLIITTSVLLTNFFVDVIYGLIDPRTRHQG
jgi:peptide/nickel transport system permease protein